MLVTHVESNARRDQAEGGELDSHEEVIDCHLRVQPRSRGRSGCWTLKRDQNREVELGSESWTCLLLQLFPNSSATDVVFVTTPHSS